MNLLHLLRSLPYLPLRPNGVPPANHITQPPNPQLEKRIADAPNTTSIVLPTATSTLPITLPNPLPSASISSYSWLTIITPSPYASEIRITSQSQLITSYVPVLTACPISASGFPPLFGKRDPQVIPGFPRPVPPIASGPLISTNYSLPSSKTGTAPLLGTETGIGTGIGVGTGIGIGTGFVTGTGISRPPYSSINLLSSTTLCSTSYSPTITPICHTTLTPLGGVPIPVSECDQQVPFSTGLGIYTLPAVGNGSGIEVLLPTTYSAPWDSVITGVPLAPVLGVYCPTGSSLCSTVTESWYKEAVGTIGSTTSEVTISAVLVGPSEIFIPPVIQKSIPAGVTTTVSIDTTYTLDYSTSVTVVVQETYLSTTTITSTSTSFHTITLSPGAVIPTPGI